MSRRTKWLLLIAGAILALGAGRMALRYLDWQQSDAKRTEVAQLQTLATSACRCTREKGEANKANCWGEYRAAIADLNVSSVATACFPISTELDCITTDAGEECIVTGFGNGVCTQEEARAVEAAYSAAWNAEGDIDTLDEAARSRANERANAALAAILERIRRGEKVAAGGPSGGCAG